MVAVAPYTGAALETWDRRSGVYDLANKIHGTLFLGDIVMLAAALLFPLSGAVLIAVLALDMLLLSRIKPLKKVLS